MSSGYRYVSGAVTKVGWEQVCKQGQGQARYMNQVSIGTFSGLSLNTSGMSTGVCSMMGTGRVSGMSAGLCSRLGTDVCSRSGAEQGEHNTGECVRITWRAMATLLWKGALLSW